MSLSKQGVALMNMCVIAWLHCIIVCLFLELHDSIKNQHQDVYIERQQAEMTSGVFNVPLPPNLTGLNLMYWTLVEIFNKWQEEYRLYIGYIKTTISILALLWIFGTNLIIESYSIYDRIFFVELIANLIAIVVIGLTVQNLVSLGHLVIRGWGLNSATTNPTLTSSKYTKYANIRMK